MKRRSFMKMCGVALVDPSVLAKSQPTITVPNIRQSEADAFCLRVTRRIVEIMYVDGRPCLHLRPDCIWVNDKGHDLIKKGILEYPLRDSRRYPNCVSKDNRGKPTASKLGDYYYGIPVFLCQKKYLVSSKPLFYIGFDIKES